MDWLLNRLKEPSSHAGIASLVGIMISTLVPPQYQVIAQIVATIFGVGAIVTPEKSRADVGAP